MMEEQRAGEMTTTQETPEMAGQSRPSSHEKPPYDGTRLRPIRIDDELWDAAKAEAEKRGQVGGVSGAVREFLREYVKGESSAG